MPDNPVNSLKEKGVLRAFCAFVYFYIYMEAGPNAGPYIKEKHDNYFKEETQSEQNIY